VPRAGPPSWPPPCWLGAQVQGWIDHQGADPLGPVDLVALRLEQIEWPSFRRLQGDLGRRALGGRHSEKAMSPPATRRGTRSSQGPEHLFRESRFWRRGTLTAQLSGRRGQCSLPAHTVKHANSACVTGSERGVCEKPVACPSVARGFLTTGRCLCELGRQDVQRRWRPRLSPASAKPLRRASLVRLVAPAGEHPTSHALARDPHHWLFNRGNPSLLGGDARSQTPPAAAASLGACNGGLVRVWRTRLHASIGCRSIGRAHQRITGACGLVDEIGGGCTLEAKPSLLSAPAT